MASLVKVTKEGRIILKVGGAIIGILIVLFMVVKGGTAFRNVFFPKPPPPPQEGLGVLPSIAFPSVGAPGIQYTINTLDGQLPSSCFPPNCSDKQIPSRVNVYKIIRPEPTLLSLQNAKQTLDSVNFVENQTKVGNSDTLYQWTQSRTGVIIQYDIVDHNFTISSNFLTNPFLASSSLLPDEKTIISDTKTFLGTINAKLDDIDFDNAKVEYLQLLNGNLVAAQNLGSARFARVTLSQKPIDNIPIVYDLPNESIISFVVSYPPGSSLQVVDGQFYDHVADPAIKSDYPVKTALQALDDLKNGKGYVVNPQNLTNVDLTNVELKYYLNRNSRDFLLPVIVFTGINFTAYVDAIPADTKNQPSP